MDTSNTISPRSRLSYGGHINANGIRQHYLRYAGPGPALVLVPGITSPAPTWGFVAERLAQHFDVYVLDVRGRGLSQSGAELDYGVNACADDLVEFVRTLALESPIYVGHSMGARILIRAATRGLEKGAAMVLVDPPVSGPGRRPYPSKIAWYTESIAQAHKGMDAEQMRQFCPTWTNEQLQRRAQWLHTCDVRAVTDSYEWFHTDDAFPDFKQLGGWRVALMVAGKGDVIRPEDIQEAQSLKSDLQILRVPGAGHMIPWDDEEDFYRVLGTFLDVTF
ncbi:MAG: alpha/beta fold hydrolase [Alcaligenes sp.]